MKRETPSSFFSPLFPFRFFFLSFFLPFFLSFFLLGKGERALHKLLSYHRLFRFHGKRERKKVKAKAKTRARAPWTPQSKGRERRARRFSFVSFFRFFLSFFPVTFFSLLLTLLLAQVQVLVRVLAAEEQRSENQQQAQQQQQKPHFELIEGCHPQTTVADLKRQVRKTISFFLLSFLRSSPTSSFPRTSSSPSVK